MDLRRGCGKRRLSEESAHGAHAVHAAHAALTTHSLPASHSSLGALGAFRHRGKRLRQPFNLQGIKLPLRRTVETLDKAQLQQLVVDIVDEHPHIAARVAEMSPRVTVAAAIAALHAKLHNDILGNLPYKMDPASDYSFLRVKTHVADFFQMLSDYTLSYLPPAENDVCVALDFAKRFLAEVLPLIPHFDAVEFRYYHNLTLEKLAHILENCIASFLAQKRQNILLVENEDWLGDFRRINNANNGLLGNVVSLLESELNAYHASGSLLVAPDGPSPGEQEPPKLQGIEALLSFTPAPLPSL